VFSLPSSSEKKEPKCRITIGEISFIAGSPKQIEVKDVENLGDADCIMKSSISVRPSTSPSWTEVPAVWDLALLPPGGISKVTFNYEWTSGTTYFLKVITEKGLETMAYGKAP
jgi:hypothetical protein